MNRKTLLTLFSVVCSLAHTQQYGWVRVAQVGDQFASLNAVTFKDSLHGWLYGFRVGFRYTTDGGNSWILSPTEPIAASDISMLDTSAGWAVGNGIDAAAIAKTIDGGRTWVEQRRFFDRVYVGTASLGKIDNKTSGYTRTIGILDTGKIVSTTNGGVSWTERTVADSIRRLGKIQFVDSTHGWVQASTSSWVGFLKTADGGATWTALSSPVYFLSFFFLDRHLGWGFDISNKFLYRTIDAGASWTVIADTIGFFDEEFLARSISFVDSSNGWLFGGASFLGDYAVIFRTTDGGYTWIRDHQGGATDLSDGLMLDRFHGWAVGGRSVFAYRKLTSVPERVSAIPTGFSLRQSYPNPFNPVTTIEYEIPSSSSVRLAVYDVEGKEVKQLVSQWQEAGVYRVSFDAGNLSSGVYFYTMKAGAFTSTKQMVFIK